MRKSTLVSRNIVVAGRRTSVRLEPEMWEGFKEICQREQSTIHTISTTLASQKEADASLTASIRVFIMGYYRRAATDKGHAARGSGMVPGAFTSPKLTAASFA